MQMMSQDSTSQMKRRLLFDSALDDVVPPRPYDIPLDGRHAADILRMSDALSKKRCGNRREHLLFRSPTEPCRGMGS